jgi:hypothetical protein
VGVGKLALAAVCLFFFAGCQQVRNIEQWKCDNLGMCHFGIRPTPTYPGVMGWNQSPPTVIDGYHGGGNVYPEHVTVPGDAIPLTPGAPCPCQQR